MSRIDPVPIIAWGGFCCCFCYFIDPSMLIFFFNVNWLNTSPLDPIQVPSYYDDDITQFWSTILLLFSTFKFPFESSPLSCCCFVLIGEGWSIAPTVPFTGLFNSSPSTFLLDTTHLRFGMVLCLSIAAFFDWYCMSHIDLLILFLSVTSITFIWLILSSSDSFFKDPRNYVWWFIDSIHNHVHALVEYWCSYIYSI